MLAQLFFLVALPILSLAAPTPPGTELYYIRNSEGQYLSPYHVAAGISDAVFVDDAELASKGYLDGSKQLFQVDSGLTWGMVLESQTYSGECFSSS